MENKEKAQKIALIAYGYLVENNEHDPFLTFDEKIMTLGPFQGERLHNISEKILNILEK